MYFSKEKGCYVPHDHETLEHFCEQLVKHFDMRKAYADGEHAVTSVLGCFADIYLAATSDTTVKTLIDTYNSAKKDLEEPPTLVSTETATMAKIQELLIQSRLEFWTYYDPEEKTHLIRFGKDLKVK